jgi:hypothetical protein
MEAHMSESLTCQNSNAKQNKQKKRKKEEKKDLLLLKLIKYLSESIHYLFSIEA